MSFGYIIKFVIITTVIIWTTIIVFDRSYNNYNIYATTSFERAIFPTYYYQNKGEDNIPLFQNDFKQIIIEIRNNSRTEIKNVEIYFPCKGAYEVQGKEKPTTLNFDNKASIKSISSNSSKSLIIYTKDKISTDYIKNLSIRCDAGEIKILEPECIYRGFYYWMLENFDTWQLIIMPMTYFLTLLIGIVLGKWGQISVDLRR